MSDEIKTEQKSEAMLGSCPQCGKLRVEIANGITSCGHSVYAAHRSSKPKDIERYIHAKTADEKIHFGRKLRMAGYEDL